MKINTVSPGPNAHPQDPVAGDGSSPADRSIEIDAGHGSGTLGPRDGTQARACPQPASETTVRLGDLLSISKPAAFEARSHTGRCASRGR